MKKKNRIAGEKWLVYGPKEYWPPIEVEIKVEREAFLKLEGLNVYLFRFDAFVLGIFAVLIGLFILFKFFRLFI